MIAGSFLDGTVLVLGLISVLGFITISADFAFGVVRARRSQTPPGSLDLIQVACTGRLRGGGGFTNIPYLLFTGSRDRLEVREMTRLHRRSTSIERHSRHKIYLEERPGRTVIVDEVSGFRAAIYSPARAHEMGNLLRAWDWVQPPMETNRCP